MQIKAKTAKWSQCLLLLLRHISHSLSQLFDIAASQCARHTEYTIHKSMTIGHCLIAYNASKYIGQRCDLIALEYLRFVTDDQCNTHTK